MRHRALGLVAAVCLLLGTQLSLPASAANDPGFNRQWGMQMIGVESAWTTSRASGQGITIAVVDTGVFMQHEDLAGKIQVIPGENFVDPSKPAADDHGHGTHVAGIAAAYANNRLGVVGVAPSARIMPVKVLDSSGRGSPDAVDSGIRFAADHGAQVINLSLGGNLASGQAVFGPSFSAAIEYAWSKGAICVVAAGNDFVTGSGFSNEPALVVSAVDRNDQKPTYSSSVGAAQWGIAAPGGSDPNTDPTEADGVFSTYWDESSPTTTNTYAYDAGTSMAAPHVAGAAAVLRSLGLSPQQTVDRLLATAKDIGAAGDDSTFGHGRLDLAKAVAGLPPRPDTSQPPTTAPPTTRAGSRSGTAPAAGRSGTTAVTAAQTSPPPVAAVGTPAPAPASPGAASSALHVVDAKPSTPTKSSRPWLATLTAAALLAAVGAAAARARASQRP